MTMNSFKKMIPWWLRICIKIIVSRLPVAYSVWKRLHLFEHGDMNEPQRALDNFLEHVQTADAMDRESSIPRLIVNAGSYVVLELGPGDSLFLRLLQDPWELHAPGWWIKDPLLQRIWLPIFNF